MRGRSTDGRPTLEGADDVADLDLEVRLVHPLEPSGGSLVARLLEEVLQEAVPRQRQVAAVGERSEARDVPLPERSALGGDQALEV
jgi:hypothetical protein